jgi:hypothetical protein
VTFTWPSLALMGLALAGFLALERAWRRSALAPRRYLAWLAALTGLAFVAHLGIVRSDSQGALALEAPSPHMHELFHYFLGTKYFAELGYSGLYRAAVLADYEDAPQDFRPDLAMRDLASDRIVARGEVAAQADAIRAPFSPERWAAFKRDVAVFRQAMPEEWRARGPVIDHGYNGTPLVTAILGGLANQPFLDTPAYLSLVSLLDPYWLALAAAAIAGLEGGATGLAFLFFAFANPLNEYGFTGGSYFRYDYLLALAGALVALRQGWRATSGVLLAAAAALRLFPAALYGCLLLRDLAGPGWRGRLRSGARLHVGFAVGALAILLLTSLVPTPDGRNAWGACAANMRKHTGAPSSNLVALSALVGYAPYKDRLVFGDEARSHAPAADPSFDWIDETRRVLAERRWYHAASALALLAVALASLRGLGAAEALFPALLVVFAILPVTHYYWALLALVPLATRDHRVWRALAASCIAFVIGASALFDSHIDLRFALWSLEMMIFLLVATALCWRRPARVAAAALALLCGVALPLAGCGKRGEGGLALPIDGNRYASRTFGFSIDKPDGWSFLTVSSLERDGDARATDRWQRWENLKKPARTPLISMAPSASPKPGADPILRVFVIPISPSEGARGIEVLTHTKADDVVTAFAQNRSRNPGFEMLEGAKPVKVAGLDGAGVRIRYRLAESEAEGAPTHPVEERLWHVRRGEEYWYFSQLGPDPLPDEMAKQLEQILASARLDP